MYVSTNHKMSNPTLVDTKRKLESLRSTIYCAQKKWSDLAINVKNFSTLLREKTQQSLLAELNEHKDAHLLFSDKSDPLSQSFLDTWQEIQREAEEARSFLAQNDPKIIHQQLDEATSALMVVTEDYKKAVENENKIVLHYGCIENIPPHRRSKMFNGTGLWNTCVQLFLNGKNHDETKLADNLSLLCPNPKKVTQQEAAHSWVTAQNLLKESKDRVRSATVQLESARQKQTLMRQLLDRYRKVLNKKLSGDQIQSEWAIQAVIKMTALTVTLIESLSILEVQAQDQSNFISNIAIADLFNAQSVFAQNEGHKHALALHSIDELLIAIKEAVSDSPSLLNIAFKADEIIRRTHGTYQFDKEDHQISLLLKKNEELLMLIGNGGLSSVIRHLIETVPKQLVVSFIYQHCFLMLDVQPKTFGLVLQNGHYKSCCCP